MDSHENARLTPRGREELVRRVREERQPVRLAAEAFGVSPKTVRKWVARFETEGAAGLRDRSSRPRRLRRPTEPARIERVVALRRERWTGKRIAAEVGVSPATVSRILRRRGLSRLRDLEPAEPVRRYERARPGELIHIDIKKLGRFDRLPIEAPLVPARWATPPHHRRPARTEQQPRRRLGVRPCGRRRPLAPGLLADQAGRDCKERIATLRAAVAWYRKLGVTVERVMTDNGSCYRYRSFAFRDACKALGLRHIRTKPYTPKTKA